MKVSNELIEKMKEFEGCSLKAYRDSAGILTIGIGHTGRDVVEGDVISSEEAVRLFRSDVAYAERVVNNLNEEIQKRTNGYGGLKQQHFDALVDLVYNAGEITIRNNNTMYNVLVRSNGQYDYPSVCRAFMLWCKITNPKTGKKEVCGGSDGKHGLVLRRAIDAAWYVYGSNYEQEMKSYKIQDIVEWARS